MKRLVVLLFALLLVVSVCGCSAPKPESGTDSDTPSSVASVSSESASSEPSRITEQEAIEIASKHWGIKSGDKDEETGFEFLIMPVEGSNDNFRIDLKWFVNNSNYSTVDSVEIDPLTGEIVNGDTEE